jgi:hypothetical protein
MIPDGAPRVTPAFRAGSVDKTAQTLHICAVLGEEVVMSARRTSLSFPLGILSLSFSVACGSTPDRTWHEAAAGTAGSGNAPVAGSGGSGTGGTSATGGAIVTAGEGGIPEQGGAPATGGTLPVGGEGGIPAQGGAPAAAGEGGTAGAAVVTCNTPAECDDGDDCNGIETCTVNHECAPGALPAACAGLDTANCLCTLVGGVCAVRGKDGDTDGVKTRLCAPDPGLDCDDTDGTITFNACTGCSTLAGGPGTTCGSCGGSTWACSGTESVVCSTPSPAPTQCSGTVIEVCTAGAWTTQTSCTGTTPICVVDAGTPKCAACSVVGETRCPTVGGATLQTCAADRMTWTTTSCAAGNACYLVSTVATCALCPPGAQRCRPGTPSTAVQDCNATGTAWVDSLCPNTTACYLSSGGAGYSCSTLGPADVDRAIEFDATRPERSFRSRAPGSVRLRPFLDLAAGFELA